MDGDRNHLSISERLARAKEALSWQNDIVQITIENNAPRVPTPAQKTRLGQSALSDFAKSNGIRLADLRRDIALLRVVAKIERFAPKLAHQIRNGDIRCEDEDIARWGSLTVSRNRSTRMWLDLVSALNSPV